MIYTYAYRNRSLSKFLPEYMSILTEATTQGYTLPSADQQVKQNLFIQTLKSNGVWDKSDLILVFANNGSKEFACINWKNPSGNKATIASSPTFTVNQGFTGNGTNSFINTNYAPSGLANYKLNDASRYVYLRVSAVNKIIDGVSGNTSNTMTTFPSVNQKINQGGVNSLTSIDFSGVGMKSMNRTSSTNITYFNDSVSGTTTATSISVNPVEQLILQSVGSFGAHQVSFYLMGASLVSENSSLVTAFSTYLNSL